MQFASQLGREADSNPNVWDMATIVPNHIRESIISWLSSATSNHWQSVGLPGDATHLLFVDACKHAWAASLTDLTTESTLHTQGSLDSRLGHCLEHSTFTEPAGLSCAIEWATPLLGPATLLTIVTDHEPLVYAVEKGFSPCLGYNHLVRTMAASTAQVRRARIVHLPGSEHPCDEPSRGLPFRPEKLAAAVAKLRGKLPTTPTG